MGNIIDTYDDDDEDLYITCLNSIDSCQSNNIKYTCKTCKKCKIKVYYNCSSEQLFKNNLCSVCNGSENEINNKLLIHKTNPDIHVKTLYKTHYMNKVYPDSPE